MDIGEIFGLWTALALSPPALYGCLYAGLRFCGTLRANREGWQAEAIGLGFRILAPALFLFAVFQPPLRLESALRRRLSRNRRPGEPAVSEVVVEVVSLA